MQATRLFVASLLATACAATFAAGQTAPAPDVVTIDQSKATNGGITAGDTAGFPITISAPGSYRLMSNLVVPSGVNGINVTTSNVTIDLNGFSITGPGACSGQSPSTIACNATSTRGISSASGNIYRLVVRNGMVGGFGICLESRYVSRASDLNLHDCDTGIVAFDGSILTQVSVHRSASAGSVVGASVEGLQLSFTRNGLSTSASALRGVVVNATYQAFSLSGGVNSSLSQSSINATLMGSGVQSGGSNLCNGVAC